MQSSQKSVALVSRTQGKRYFQKENFGRAFAHILLALKLCPHWKNELKELFTSSLCNWGEELEAKGRFYDLFNCYEQALEIFPENEKVVNNLGAHLFRSGHLNEASFYFERALKIKSDYIPAYRNLQSVSNLLVERWHFRMLNDAHRNEAYREAIFKKIGQGFDFVLDIGTGTGLLSYFAVDSGSQNVFACDYSQIMIDMAKKIAKFNGIEDNVKFIWKLSNDLIIPDDIPRRASLLVTETMDAGLFGEHLIQTLLHAWKCLLLPPLPPASLVPPVPCIICRDVELCRSTRRNGIVLPFGASLWFAAVECASIAQKCRLLSNKRTTFKSGKPHFLLTANLNEPYDSENLNRIANGYRFLCEPINCFYVNFNDVNELQDYFDGKYDENICNVKFSSSGSLDCFVFWFDLHLDEDIKLSSSPLAVDENSDSCCWDQAVFPVQNELIVSPDTSVDVKVKTKCGKLGLQICTVNNACFSFSSDKLLTASQDTVRYLNNSSVIRSLDSVARLIENENKILDLSPFPALYFNLLRNVSTSASCIYVAKSKNELNVIQKLAVAEGINLDCISCVLEKDFESVFLFEDSTFDLIVTNLIDSTGEFKETSIEQLPNLSKLLKPDGRIFPEKISVWGQLISSRWLRRSAEVLNEGLIEKFHIADFINKHKASQQLDLCLNSVEHIVLSEEFQIMQLTINDLLHRTSKEFQYDIPVIASGEATAIVYWFQCHLISDYVMFSTRNVDSHINQVAVMIKKNHQVVSGDIVKFNGKFSDAGFIFNVE